MLTANTDYTISNAKYDGVNATGEGAATKVDFDVALADTTLANNYKLKTEKGTQDSQTIEKADTTDKTTSTSGIRGQENTFDMPDGFMVEGANIASITVTKNDNSILAHEPKYADNKLTYELNNYAENGQSAVTRLKISSQNYDFYFIDITIGVDEKQEVAITIDDATLTYNATPQAPTGITVENDLVPTNELVITYVGTGSTIYPESSTAPTDAGTYSMSVSVPGTNTQYKGSATKAFTIAPKEISATLKAENKIYDGNTSAQASATLTGVFASDTGKVTATVTNPVFENKNVDENKKVTASITITGDAAKNYTVNDTAETTANITPKEITISDVTVEATKVYDGSANATITNNGTLNDVETGDTVTIKPGTATYDNKNVGENKTVTLSGFELEGTDAGNYTLTQPAATSAAITAKALTIAPVVIAEKYYDGTNKADYIATPKLVGVVNDEDVTLMKGTPTFSTVSVGRDIPINFTDFALDGTDKGNYTLIQPTDITADISAYISSRMEYTTTTKEWTDQDFVVTAKSGWQVSTTNTADGEWSDTLTCSNETGNTSDSLTFYVKNATYGFISEVITENYKIDKTAPVISGAEDGKTYCAAVTLSITDENLDTVTLNGDIVTIEDDKLTSANNNFDTAELSSETATMTDGKLTLGPAEGEQIVVATDKAGNSSSITVTVNGDHTWGAWTSDGDGAHHTRICQIDSTHIETAECHGGVATCKDKAVCEDCKSSYGELDPQNHVNLIRVEAKAATTDAEGNIEYWYCDACDKYYEDADATKEITKADTVIAKLDSDSTANTSPSAGNENTAKTLAKTGNDTTTKTLAKTGDENIMFILMALILASGAAVATTTLVCRKKKHNR